MKTLNEQVIMLVEYSLCYAAKYGKYVQYESTRLFDNIENRLVGPPLQQELSLRHPIKPSTT